MFSFQLAEYPSAITELLAAASLNELGPASPRSEFREQLQELNEQSLGESIVDRQMAACCLSALWLRFDFLDESHQISQSIETPAGSYWHGIMHRREPDYSNAKYWFRRAGDQPIFGELSKCAARLASEAGDVGQSLAAANWDASHFVDLCQQSASSGGELESVCRQIADAEWQLMFDDCFCRAVRM